MKKRSSNLSVRTIESWIAREAPCCINIDVHDNGVGLTYRVELTCEREHKVANGTGLLSALLGVL